MNKTSATIAHHIARALGINLTYTVRRLGTGYKRSETRGLAICQAETPAEAFDQLKEAIANAQEKGTYYVLAEARLEGHVVAIVHKPHRQGSGKENVVGEATSSQ